MGNTSQQASKTYNDLVNVLNKRYLVTAMGTPSSLNGNKFTIFLQDKYEIIVSLELKHSMVALTHEGTSTYSHQISFTTQNKMVTDLADTIEYVYRMYTSKRAGRRGAIIYHNYDDFQKGEHARSRSI